MTNPAFDPTIDRRDTDSIKWSRYRGEEVIPMWVADMEYATAPPILEAMRKRVEHPMFGYTHASTELAFAVVRYLHERHEWQIEPDWLCWLPGVLPGLTAACSISGNAGDRVLVCTPVYHPLLHIPPKLGRERIDVPMLYADHRWSIDFDLLEREARAGAAALLLSSPHNPMGTLFTRDELRQVAEICARYGVTPVSDEIHCDLVLDPDARHMPTAVAAPELAERSITLMSPSKTFNLAGANCSFAIIPDPKIRERFVAECRYSVPLVPTFSYTAALAAYAHGWPWHASLIDYLRGNLATLRAAVDAMPALWMDDPQATYLAWINTSALPVADAGTFFHQAGVGLSPGTQFGDPQYQRLNFACSRNQLDTALQRMHDAIATL